MSLHQNAKVAVKSRAGKQAIPQEAYAAHYCFQMDFCNVRSGNKKGFGENLVGTIRCNALSTATQVRAKGSCSFYGQSGSAIHGHVALLHIHWKFSEKYGIIYAYEYAGVVHR